VIIFGIFLCRYERPDTFYSFGWSHGREKLQGKPDYAKGSFYANPQYDRPVDDEALIKQFAPFIHPNVWPTEDLPALEPRFKALGQLVVEVGALVGKQCDAYVKSKCEGYSDFKLFEIISSSKCCKARLLHYFSKDSAAAAARPDELDSAAAPTTDTLEEKSEPPTAAAAASNDDDLFSDWCGWHNDHGSLTGLVPAMFVDAAGTEIPNPDPNAGLYIKSRSGELVRAVMPPGGSSLAFQIGETAQIHSGGLLQATPHAVRGADVPGVTRETFAVFMEPNWDGDMVVPPGRTAEEAQTNAAALALPPGVPPLGKRWKEGMDFGQFTDATLSSYY
jgi:isopenicillin N synthase-like dioxygenase